MQIKSENFIVDSIFYRYLCLLNIELSQFETYHSCNILRTSPPKAVYYDVC